MKYQITKQVGDLQITATSEVYFGELLDTTIEIEGGIMCCVAGNEREEFIQKMQELINKYRI